MCGRHLGRHSCCISNTHAYIVLCLEAELHALHSLSHQLSRACIGASQVALGGSVTPLSPNSVHGLLTAVVETGRKDLVRKFMGFVARCYRVARCCHENLAQWQARAEV
jgi:hypothetical protein